MGLLRASDAAQHLGKSGDGGIDGLIRRDPLGLDVVYIQAKCYAADNAVGAEKIQQFIGALAAKGAAAGVFVTTSRFTEQALAAKAARPRLVLIDGRQLTQLMLRHGIGVRTVRTFEVKKLDLEYFETEEG